MLLKQTRNINCKQELNDEEKKYDVWAKGKQAHKIKRARASCIQSTLIN